MKRDPVVVAVALSLYAYNVSAVDRARAIHEAFNGQCSDVETLTEILIYRSAFAATELAMPSAEVYVNQALAKYGKEAEQRVRINREGYDVVTQRCVMHDDPNVSIEGSG